MPSFPQFRNIFAVFYLQKIKKLRTPANIIKYGLNVHADRKLFQDNRNDKTISFAEAAKMIADCKRHLEAYHLKQHDVVTLLNGSPLDYYIIRSACHFMGLIFFALPPGLSDESVIYFINTTKSLVICFDNISEEITKYAKLHGIHLLDINNKTNVQEPDGIKTDVITRPHDTATYNLSSGTTGKTPKVVKISNQNWITSLYNFILNADTSNKSTTVFYSTLPSATAGSTTFLPTFLAGMTQVIAQNPFTIEELSDTILRQQVNRLFITPTNFYKFFHYSKNLNKHYPDLKQIIIGTEVTSANVIKRAVEYFGPVIYISYGMVEVLPPLTMLAPKDYYSENIIAKEKLDTVGKVLKGVEVKLLNENGDQLLTSVRIGKIAIKGGTVTGGYFNRPEETQLAYFNNWFHSDDYGMFDEDNNLKVLGRKEDIVFRDKEQIVFASEIENEVYALDEILHCAAVSHQDGIGIVFSMKPEFNNNLISQIEELIHACLGEEIHIRIVEHKEIPVTALGKINRYQCKNILHG